MGMRKRSGKNRHKGKGRKRYKRSDSYDEDEPMSSGLDSDPPSDTELTDTPVTKATRRRYNHDSDSNGRTQMIEDEGIPVSWILLIIVVSVTVFVTSAVAMYFLFPLIVPQNIISYLNPFALREDRTQTPDFIQEQNPESYTAKENCENDLLCLKNKEKIETPSEHDIIEDSGFEDDSDNEDTLPEHLRDKKIYDENGDSLNRNSVEMTDTEKPSYDSKSDMEFNEIDKDIQDLRDFDKIIADDSFKVKSEVRDRNKKIAESSIIDDVEQQEEVSLSKESSPDVESSKESSPDVVPSKESSPDVESTESSSDVESTKSSPDDESSSDESTPDVESKESSPDVESSTDAESSPDVEPSKESSPYVEPSKEPSPYVEPSKEPSPDVEPSKESSPDVEPSKESSPDVEPSNKLSPDVEPSQESSPDVESSQESSPDVESSNESSPDVEPSDESSPDAESSNKSSPDVEPSNESSSDVEPSKESDVKESNTRHVGDHDQDKSNTVTDSHQNTDDKIGGGENVKSLDCATGEDGNCDKPAPKSTYPKADITNPADNRIRHELDEADFWLENKKENEAHDKYKHIVSRFPRSPRAIDGLAQALCKLAEIQQSNPLLEQCIEQYMKILETPDVPKALMLRSGRACANRQQFRGFGPRAVKVFRQLIDKYPEETALLNELGVQYLMIGRSTDAKAIFSQMLKVEPSNVFAKAHMGFIYKTSDNNLQLAVPLLREALLTGDPSVNDGRFYFHLGDSLQRIGNVTEAHLWYEKGARLGLFRSKWQRSLYNVEHLTGRSWWTQEETGQMKLIKELEKNWEVIRKEGMSNIDESGSFRPEEENLREKGDWKQLTLYQQGRKNEQNCKRAPKTCALIEKFPDAATCKRGQVKFSVMHPGVHVWPHCGPTNCRIRMHLGLSIPKDCCKIRVIDDTRTWEEGKVIVFDDSFEHEVWHDGDAARLVLIVDIWHPELTARHRAALSPI